MLSIKLKLKKSSKQLQLRLEHHITIQYRCRRPDRYLGAFLRLDNAWPGSLDVAMKKAKAVAGHSPLHNCKVLLSPEKDCMGWGKLMVVLWYLGVAFLSCRWILHRSH